MQTAAIRRPQFWKLFSFLVRARAYTLRLVVNSVGLWIKWAESSGELSFFRSTIPKQTFEWTTDIHEVLLSAKYATVTSAGE